MITSLASRRCLRSSAVSCLPSPALTSSACRTSVEVTVPWLIALVSPCNDTTAKFAFGEMIARQCPRWPRPFTERLPYSGLMWRFQWDYHQALLRWGPPGPRRVAAQNCTLPCGFSDIVES